VKLKLLPITKRQHAVLKDLCAGLPYKQVWDKYQISEGTFRNDCRAIRQAFNAETNLAAAYQFGRLSKKNS
jgi:DNA-binding NarL/FixJ family response regulator